MKSWLAECAIITPKKVELGAGFDVLGNGFIREGKRKPSPSLFSFPDLWADYGFEATLDQGRLKITNARADGPFSHLLKLGDIILARKEQKVESAGQFRRLLGHALDIGSFDFEIERAGQNMPVRAQLRKRQTP